MGVMRLAKLIRGKAMAHLLIIHKQMKGRREG